MHDRNGKDLEVGDIVNIPCRVALLDHTKENWNNATLVALEPNFPGEYRTEFGLNSKQLEFVSREPAPLLAVAPEIASAPVPVVEEEIIPEEQHTEE